MDMDLEKSLEYFGNYFWNGPKPKAMHTCEKAQNF